MVLYEKAKHKTKIMIVDDIAMSANLLKEVLAEEGYQVQAGSEVGTAMRMIKEQLPDLILLDLTMPGMSGLDFYRQLQKDVHTKEIPVIFLSAVSSCKIRTQCFQLGAVDFIQKPYDIEEIKVRVSLRLRQNFEKKQLQLYNKNLYGLLNQQMRNTLLEEKTMLHAVSTLISDQQKITQERVDQVARNCRLLSIALQFRHDYDKVITNSFPDMIEMVAPFRDIGMFGFEEELICQEKKLTPEQLEKYQQHPVLGSSVFYEIQSHNQNTDLWQMAYEIALYHHEQWNGGGYPMGLSGIDIPLSARIVSIISAFDLFSHESCHGEACSIQAAVRKIAELSGQDFDPGIVGIFLKIYQQLN